MSEVPLYRLEEAQKKGSEGLSSFNSAKAALRAQADPNPPTRTSKP